MADVSIVVCTHNRPHVLDRCVTAALATAPATLDAEILLVDSGSVDTTASEIARLAAQHPRVRTLRVDPAGVARARQAAFGATDAPIVVFLDDDAIARPGWLAAIVEPFSRPEVSWVAGHITVQWPGGSRPRWFDSSLERWWAGLDLGPTARPLVAGEFAFSANMALRRAPAVAHTGYGLEPGAGAQLHFQQEIEPQLRLRAAGHEGWWQPTAAVDHVMEPGRVSPRWVLTRAAQQGRAEVETEESLGTLTAGHAARRVAAHAVSGLAGQVARAVTGPNRRGAALDLVAVRFTAIAYARHAIGRARRANMGALSGQSGGHMAVTGTAAIDTIAKLARVHGKERPDKPALTAGDRTLTYAELDARSSQVAQALAAEGVGPEDRVAYLDKNTIEYFELLLGGGKLNAVMVAVNWRLAPPEVAYIVNDAQAKVFVVGEEFVPILDAIRSELTTVKKFVVVGGEYDDWVSSQPAVDPGIDSAPEDVAFQLYTSGTTGLPKGVMLTNRNLFTLLPTAAPDWLFDEDSQNLVAMPLFHIGGSGYATVGMFMGCHTILMKEVNPVEMLQLIVEKKITNAFAVPAVLQFMLSVPGVADIDFSALRCIVYGASPISVEVLAKSIETFKCSFIQAYGLTETTGAITTLMPEDHDPNGKYAHRLRSAGRPIQGVELRIVSADTGDDAAQGEVGEIWSRTLQNMKGYWGKPEDTARTITPDGWLKTGDAGYLDEDGYLYIHDRVKDMIVSGGENIYPAEVENCLMSHPDIADVAVIGVPSDKWGETVKALVVKKEGADPSPESIIAFAKERIAGFKCPTSVDWIDVLPRNPSGKILKRELRAPYWEGKERNVG